MSKGTIVSSVVALIIIIGGASYFYFGPDSLMFWKTKESPKDTVIPFEPEHERINAKHQFKNGTHIIAGEVNQPTPCYILTTDARVAESFPEQVTINFVSTTEAEACIQVVTTERFKVEFQASKDTTIRATWNGRPVELNLIPAGANEDLTNFEIFIKG